MLPRFKVSALLVSVMFVPASEYFVQPRLSDAEIQPQLIPRDPQYSNQQSSFALIGLESAWDITTGDETVIVAVIDDAIDIHHPDLVGNLVEGYDFVAGDSDPSPDLLDSCSSKASHGTAMASIIGAVGDNNTGMSGVSWNVKIMPLRVGCRYSYQYEEQAIQYAINNGAHIINMSYGGPRQTPYDGSYLQQLRNSNVLFVAAAGNYHSNNDFFAMYPAGMDIPNMLSVAAVDRTNRLTPWTQYGALSVDVAAPGESILTIDLDNGGYNTASGTSVATAIVSGVAALMKAHDMQDGTNDFSGSELRSALIATVTAVPEAQLRLAGGGTIHAQRALNALVQRDPVLLIKDVAWEQESLYPNGIMDANESGNLVLTLENLGQDTTNIVVEVISSENILSFSSRQTSIASLAAENSAKITFPVQVHSFVGHKKLPFELKITASSIAGSVSYTRGFQLQSDFLPDKAFIQSRLRETDFDESKNFHLNVPPGTENVIFELAYPPDQGQFGLAISRNTPPRLNFAAIVGGDLQIPGVDKVKISGLGVERVAFPVNAGEEFHLSVFDMLPNEKSATNEVSFELRACHFGLSETNIAPSVNAGPDVSVEVGDVVTLEGKVSDVDGDVSLVWWDSDANDNVSFANARGQSTQVQFSQAGIYTLKLNASDNVCGYASDTLTALVQDENDLGTGLRITPPSYASSLGNTVLTNIQGQIEGQGVNNLTMVHAPPGVVFDKQTRQLTWVNAGPVGEYEVRFSGSLSGSSELKYGLMTINISDRSSRNSGSIGCAMVSKTNFDPIFLLLVFLSLLYVLRKPPADKN